MPSILDNALLGAAGVADLFTPWFITAGAVVAPTTTGAVLNAVGGLDNLELAPRVYAWQTPGNTEQLRQNAAAVWNTETQSQVVGETVRDVGTLVSGTALVAIVAGVVILFALK